MTSSMLLNSLPIYSLQSPEHFHTTDTPIDNQSKGVILTANKKSNELQA